MALDRWSLSLSSPTVRQPREEKKAILNLIGMGKKQTNKQEQNQRHQEQEDDVVAVAVAAAIDAGVGIFLSLSQIYLIQMD